MIDLGNVGRGAPPMPRSTGKTANATTKNSATFRLPGENSIYGGGDGLGQQVYADYTKDSTPEDPIVRISGESLSGSFDFIVHINDIDPRHASYAELCALVGHKSKIGEYKSRSGWLDPVPVDVEVGDFIKPQNFLSKIKTSIANNCRNGCPQIYQDGERLLAFYENFLEKNGKDSWSPSVTVDSLRDYASHKQSLNAALRSFLNTLPSYSMIR